jgi:RNA polymerase sigma-70 factor (ECF subfamily)
MTTAKNPNRKKIKDNDTEIIKAINSGQFDLFHELVKRYEQKLYNFSLRMCRDPSDAEDMVQETFLNVSGDILKRISIFKRFQIRNKI